MAYGKDLGFHQADPNGKVMRSRPTLLDQSIEWCDAFQALHGSRQQTMNGPGAILVSEVNAYCDLTGVDVRDRPAFLRMIKKIDNGVLESIERRGKTVLKQPPKDTNA